MHKCSTPLNSYTVSAVVSCVAFVFQLGSTHIVFAMHG